MSGASERAAAFDAIYTEHAQALHAYFVGRTSDVELARDLAGILRVRRLVEIQTVSPSSRCTDLWPSHRICRANVGDLRLPNYGSD